MSKPTKKLLPADIVRRTVKTLFNAWMPGVDPEEAMEKLRSFGAHHGLMELAYPETDDMEGMEYGGSLDAFEGDLSTWLDEAAEDHAEHEKRVAKRDGLRPGCAGSSG